MSSFGVGPAARGRNVGLPTRQDSRIVGRGKVLDKNGRTVFDPTVNNTDLLVGNDPVGSDNLEAVFLTRQQLTLAFADKLADVPIGYRIDGDNGSFDSMATRLLILQVPGENVSVPESTILEIATAQGYGPVATTLPVGSIFTYEILSGSDGVTREVDPVDLTLGGRNNTSFLANGKWDYYSDAGSNSWYNAPETLTASGQNEGKATIIVIVDTFREVFDGADDYVATREPFGLYTDPSVEWPPTEIS